MDPGFHKNSVTDFFLFFFNEAFQGVEKKKHIDGYLHFLCYLRFLGGGRSSDTGFELGSSQHPPWGSAVEVELGQRYVSAARSGKKGDSM